ncbi:MAG: NAD(P)/FAD-dependent oxidoreductase [Acidimicrobiaceae bacterium]|nr:NAD(P)/FAD-dependent oxidoreductase [Acidimicrobiaceae bacterium]
MAWDSIVIGAGHNGLVAANYLADHGDQVLVLERRSLVGGATVTEELIDGYRMSSCSYVAGMIHPEVLRDLQLDRHGLELYQTDMGSANILADGRHVFLYRDLAKTLNEIERVDPGSSEGFVEFGLRLQRFAQLTRPFLLESDPPQLSAVAATFEAHGEEDLFNEFFTLSVHDLLARYITSEILTGLMTFLGVVSVWGGPRTPGWSYVYGHHAIGEVDGQMGQFAFPRGGMGSFAEALAARARAKGVEIRTGAAARSIIVEQGRVRGVVLADGDEVRASTVASGADPVTTYGRLTDRSDLPGGFAAAIDRFDVRGSMARVFVAVDRLPQFVGCGPGEGPEHRGLTLLGAEVEAFERVADAQRYGRVPSEFPVELIIQSVHDPSMAPEGHHLISTGVQQLPFELAEGDWDTYRDQFTRDVLGQLERYIPGLAGTVVGTATITPLDLEREYGMAGGNIFHGALTLGQIFEARPVPGHGSYRSPIAGLYLCGSGAHPGGAVTGVPGRNAALAIVSDRTAGGWGGPRGREATQLVSRPWTHRLMDRPALRRLGMWATRHERLSPVVRALTRRR